MECPNIDKFIPDPNFNKPINYKDLGGDVDYIFYERNDAFGQTSWVQYCERLGRKGDVFECLNQVEWKNCAYYKAKALMKNLGK